MFLETITPEMTDILKRFSEIPRISDHFYLAGGTALALQCGHRKSMDLDFFHAAPFSVEPLSSILVETGATITIAEEGTIHGSLKGTKVSFLHYPYPLLKGYIPLYGIRLAQKEDIACMKVLAVAQRSEKKDFFDIYEVLKIFTATQLKEMVLKKYGEQRVNCYHILRSFFYFSQADLSPEPMSLNGTAWQDVKEYFVSREAELRQALCQF